MNSCSLGLLTGGIVTPTPVEVTTNYSRFTKSAEDLQIANTTETAHLAEAGWIGKAASTFSGRRHVGLSWGGRAPWPRLRGHVATLLKKNMPATSAGMAPYMLQFRRMFFRTRG